jgi:hypothetical protein
MRGDGCVPVSGVEMKVATAAHAGFQFVLVEEDLTFAAGWTSMPQFDH